MTFPHFYYHYYKLCTVSLNKHSGNCKTLRTFAYSPQLIGEIVSAVTGWLPVELVLHNMPPTTDVLVATANDSLSPQQPSLPLPVHQQTVTKRCPPCQKSLTQTFLCCKAVLQAISMVMGSCEQSFTFSSITVMACWSHTIHKHIDWWRVLTFSLPAAAQRTRPKCWDTSVPLWCDSFTVSSSTSCIKTLVHYCTCANI